MQSHRNLAFLESELDAINAQEQEKIAESDRQLQIMQKKLREEELKILRGQAQVDERSLDEALLTGEAGGARAMKRPGGASRGGRGGYDADGGEGAGYGGAGEVYGSMQARRPDSPRTEIRAARRDHSPSPPRS